MMKQMILLMSLALVLTTGAFAQTAGNTYMEAVRKYHEVCERKTALDADIDSLMALFEKIKAADAHYREECNFYMEKISKWCPEDDPLWVVSVKTELTGGLFKKTLKKAMDKNGDIDSDYKTVRQNADGVYLVDRGRATYYVELNTAYESATSDVAWIQISEEKIDDNILTFSVPATSDDAEHEGVLVISKGSQKLQLKFKKRAPQTYTIYNTSKKEK